MHRLIEQAIKDYLGSYLNKPIEQLHIVPVTGGNINIAFKILTHSHSFFCKLNNATKFPQLFEKEKHGLKTLASINIIRTPGIIGCFEINDIQILIIEWIEPGEQTPLFWEQFGHQLASLHLISTLNFGFSEWNYMGCVIQDNKSSFDWINFFINQRLEPIIKKCTDSGLLTSKHCKAFEFIYKQLDHIFPIEPASLLHGDLWSGNVLCSKGSTPVLIDPAVYYGHRSMDLAMTTLFGKFDPLFYQAYNNIYPLPKNYKEQWQVCHFYPLLIHLFLFGISYRSRIETILNSFQR